MEKYEKYLPDTLPYLDLCCRPQMLSWMRIQLVIRRLWVRPLRVGNILLWRLIMVYFLWSFSPFHGFKKGNCQFLARAWPVKVWLGKLTMLHMSPLGWVGRKTSTQTNKQKTCLSYSEALLMSTHNICFYGDIRKIIPELSPDTQS